MHEPPHDLSDDEVLQLLRRHWSREVDRVEHLPAGFGAHHWRASAGFRPLLFATYDDLARPRHTAASLEAAYAGAAELAFRLDTVVAGLPTHDLRRTVPVASGALSVTPWVEGEPAGDGPTATREDAERTVRMLARLHAAAPPNGIPRWEPIDTSALGDLVASVDLQRHAELVERATEHPWVATHGDPQGHQLITVVRTLLVGWSSLRLAPRERDLAALVRAGHADLLHPCPDPHMLELFDLERRLEQVRRRTAPSHR